MTAAQIDKFLKNLINLCLEWFSEHGVDDTAILAAIQYHGTNFSGNYTSIYDTDERCLSYALRYGIKTAYQTWSNIGDAGISTKIRKIVIVGGGCSFELPVILKCLSNDEKRIRVHILDKYAASWKIFEDFHKEIAERMDIELTIKYTQFDLKKDDLKTYLGSQTPCLVVASNVLNELDDNDLNKFIEACKSENVFIQDMVLNKFQRVREALRKSAHGYANHLHNFPESELRAHLISKNDAYQGHGVYNNILGGKNYKFISERE